jgi:YihY family inner membrane protein
MIMASAQHSTHAHPHHQRGAGIKRRIQRDAGKVEGDVNTLKQKFAPLLNFWMKAGNDWVPQLADMLAFNFLTSIFPLLLVILAIAGFVLGAISPGAQVQLQHSVAGALPAGIGRTVVAGVMNNLNRSAGPIIIIGILGAFFSGSRLFIAIENCSGIIFRLRRRDALHQNIMALSMTLLYIVLVPLIFAATTLSTALLHLIGWQTQQGLGAVAAWVVGAAVGYLAAVILFGAIYIVVPNYPAKLSEAWRGALVAAALLVIYELVFPFYASHFLKPNNYGAIAGFAIVILIFFYYLAFILLLGMEINSWASGQRETASDISSIMHEVQAHDTTRGVAGPKAGQPQEDLQNNEGARAMHTPEAAIHHERRDHPHGMRPPKYAETDQKDATAVPPRQGRDAPASVRQRAQQSSPPAGKNR